MVKEDKNFARYMYLFCSEISPEGAKKTVFTVQPIEPLRAANIIIPRNKYNQNYNVKPYENSLPFKIKFGSKTIPVTMDLISYKAFGQPEVLLIFAYLDLNLLAL